MKRAIIRVIMASLPPINYYPINYTPTGKDFHGSYLSVASDAKEYLPVDAIFFVRDERIRGLAYSSLARMISRRYYESPMISEDLITSYSNYSASHVTPSDMKNEFLRVIHGRVVFPLIYSSASAHCSHSEADVSRYLEIQRYSSGPSYDLFHPIRFQKTPSHYFSFKWICCTLRSVDTYTVIDIVYYLSVQTSYVKEMKALILLGREDEIDTSRMILFVNNHYMHKESGALSVITKIALPLAVGNDIPVCFTDNIKDILLEKTLYGRQDDHIRDLAEAVVRKSPDQVCSAPERKFPGSVWTISEVASLEDTSLRLTSVGRAGVGSCPPPIDIHASPGYCAGVVSYSHPPAGMAISGEYVGFTPQALLHVNPDTPGEIVTFGTPLSQPSV